MRLKFQLTRLMRGVTADNLMLELGEKISTHTPHARRDENIYKVEVWIWEFQLTRLMRGVTGRFC